MNRNILKKHFLEISQNGCCWIPMRRSWETSWKHSTIVQSMIYTIIYKIGQKTYLDRIVYSHPFIRKCLRLRYLSMSSYTAASVGGEVHLFEVWTSDSLSEGVARAAGVCRFVIAIWLASFIHSWWTETTRQLLFKTSRIPSTVLRRTLYKPEKRKKKAMIVLKSLT